MIFLFFLAEKIDAARSNAQTILRCTTAYPFRVNDKCILCVYCQELYEDPDQFRKHVDEEHENFTVKVVFHNLPKPEFIKADLTNLHCRLCSNGFDSLDTVAEHLHTVHKERLDLSAKLGVMPYYLRKDVFNCAVCGKSFPSLFHLNRHTITHFLSYVCHVCGNSYVATTGLLRHVRSKHQDYEVSCKKCRRVFPTMEAKERHRRTEKSCMPYCCPKCLERFLDWKSRKRHMETAHGQSKKVYRCADCNLEYSSENGYYDHYRLQHSEDCATCKHCGLKFTSRYRLKRHITKHIL